MSVTVRDNVAQTRYEVFVEDQLAGFEDYKLSPGRINFLHTEIDSSFTGQGLAATLVKFALDDARSRDLTVRPYCPYVAKYIREHSSEYLELVPASDRDRFDL
ncbi:MAG TPA: GNAT family N-acetyltransferase [Acidimicrobiales bacterium]